MRGALAGAALAVACVASCSTWHRAAGLRFVTEPGGAVVVELGGLDSSTATALASRRSFSEWSDVLSVHVDFDGDGSGATGGSPADALPPMVGDYRVEADAVRFTPRFPLAPGLRYVAVYRPKAAGLEGPRLELAFTTPDISREPTTVVEHVYPSSDTLPENHLRFYVQFSSPMSRGRSYERIRLIDDRGEEVELPFLELDEELWDPGGIRFTLLIDPGRVKRGVRPLEEIGPALEAGRCYELVIDRAWRDARGVELAREHRKRFCVGPPDRESPDPGTWEITAPAAESRTPLLVRFPEPLDHGLLQRMLWVIDADGRAVDGTSTVGDGETSWTFTPAAPWNAGPHELAARTTLEDHAGNSIGRPFEVDVFETVRERVHVTTVTVPFRVASR